MGNSKLQELTDKLFQEGLEKGRAEADNLVAEAKSNAAKIVAEAEARAAEIVAAAETKAVDIEKNAMTEITLAGKQAIAKIKAEIETLIVAKTTTEGVKAANLDADFIKEMLLAVAKLDSLGYDIADKLGDTSIKGNVSFAKENIGGEIAVDFKNGSIVADGSMVSGGRYAFKVEGHELNLKELVGIDKLEGCRINITADGNIKDKRNLANVSGSIVDLEYNDYRYAPIVFNGKYVADKITAKVETDDPNVKMQLAADCSLADEKKMRVTLKSDRFIPANLNIFESEREQDFVFGMNGEYIDYGSGKTIVNAKIDNISLLDDGDTTFIRNFYISDNKAGDDRLFVVTSDFATASVYGSFDFKSIRNSLVSILKSHLPVLDIAPVDVDYTTEANNFYYDFNL